MCHEDPPVKNVVHKTAQLGRSDLLLKQYLHLDRSSTISARISAAVRKHFHVIQRAFAVALLLSLAVTSGCMAVGALSVSGLAGAGQAMTSGSQDISRYDVYQGHAIWQSYSRDAVYQLKSDVF